MDALNGDEVQSYLHAPEFGRRLLWVRFRSFAGTGASGQPGCAETGHPPRTWLTCLTQLKADSPSPRPFSGSRRGAISEEALSLRGGAEGRDSLIHPGFEYAGREIGGDEPPHGALGGYAR